MDVVDQWNGRYACALQSALRLTNEGFAKHLGVAPRTVAAWHADPAVVPRAEIQQVLDAAHERAPQTARSRFARIVDPAVAAARSGDPEVGHPLRVAIAVVVRQRSVLLVCRRDDPAGITWAFPAGVIKPGVRPDATAVRETLNETGVHCAIGQHIGSRIHPVNGVFCEYFLAEHLAGEGVNGDEVENVDVMWVPIASMHRFIPEDSLFPPILAVLKEET